MAHERRGISPTALENLAIDLQASPSAQLTAALERIVGTQSDEEVLEETLGMWTALVEATLPGVYEAYSFRSHRGTGGGMGTEIPEDPDTIMRQGGAEAVLKLLEQTGLILPIEKRYPVSSSFFTLQAERRPIPQGLREQLYALLNNRLGAGIDQSVLQARLTDLISLSTARRILFESFLHFVYLKDDETLNKTGSQS